jgi:hypothetical protein
MTPQPMVSVAVLLDHAPPAARLVAAHRRQRRRPDVVHLGFGRTVALYYSPSTSYQIH